MANLTQEQNIIKDLGTDLKPENGYELLIFKRGEYLKTISPGRRPTLSVKDRMSVLTAYAVRKDKELELKFSERHAHSDKVRFFFVDYHLYYEIINPLSLVDQIAHDPLKRLRNRIVDLLGQYLAYTDWNQLQDAELFLHLKPSVLKDPPLSGLDSRSNWAQIQDFANDLGFKVLKIDFERRIPEKFTTIEQAEVEDQTEAELEQIQRKKKRRQGIYQREDKEAEHELRILEGNQEVDYHRTIGNDLGELKRMQDRKQQLNSALDAAISAAITSIGEGIDDIDKLKEAAIGAAKLQQFFEIGQMAGETGAMGGNALGGSTIKQLGEGTNTSTQPLSGPLASIIQTLRRSDVDDTSQRELLAICLHLIAILVHRYDNDDPAYYHEKQELIISTLKEDEQKQTEDLNKIRETITKELKRVKKQLKQW